MNHKGNVALMVVFVLLTAAAASITLISQLSEQYQKTSLKSRNWVSSRLALNSALDYTVHAVKERWCLNEDWSRNNNYSETSDSDFKENLCTLNNPRNTERLVLFDEALRDFKEQFGQFNLPNPDKPEENRIESVVDLSEGISETHPLSTFFKYVKETGAKKVYFTIQRERYDSAESTQKRLMFNKEVLLKIKVRVEESRFSKDISSEVLLAVYPREISTFSLVLQGDLVLDSNLSPDSYNSSSVVLPAISKNEKENNNFQGIKFHSPIFVNSNVVIPAEENNYSPVTFGDAVIIGGGKLYEGKNVFSPHSAGGFGDRYNFEHETFGGFLKGVVHEGVADAGLPYLFGDAIDQPEERFRCRRWYNIQTDMHFSSDSRLLVKQLSSPADGKFSYRFGISHANKFVPQSREKVGGALKPQAQFLNKDFELEAPKIIQSTVQDNYYQNPVLKAVILDYSGEPIAEAMLSADTRVELKLKNDISKEEKQIQDIDKKFPNLENDLLSAQQKVDQFLADQFGISGQLDENEIHNQICQNLKGKHPYCNPGVKHKVCKKDDEDEESEDEENCPKLKEIDQYVKLKNDFSELNEKNDEKTKTQEALQSVIDHPSELTITSKPFIGNSLEAHSDQINIDLEFKNIKNIPTELLRKIKSQESQEGFFSIRFEPFEVGSDGYGSVKEDRKIDPGPLGANNKINFHFVGDRFALNFKSEMSSLGKDSGQINFMQASESQWWMFQGSGAFTNGALDSSVGKNLTYKVSGNKGDGVLPSDYFNPRQLDKECDFNEVSSQLFSYNPSDFDFANQARYSWNFKPPQIKDPVDFTVSDTGTDVVLTANPKLNDQTNYSSREFHIFSIAKNCIIKADAPFVAGFFTCDHLIIEERDQPLILIGTYLVGEATIPKSAAKSGLEWMSIYNPAASVLLMNNRILRKPDGSLCDLIPSKPVWALKMLSLQDEVESLSCTPGILRSKAEPFRWTAVDPNCGLLNDDNSGRTQETVCGVQARAKRFLYQEIYRKDNI